MITLSPAGLKDADTLFRWRNHPSTRTMMLSTDPIAWEDHLAWLERSLRAPDRLILIACKDGVPVGTVRLDTTEEGTELSWSVSPDHRGQGIGAAMLKAAVPCGPTIARIKRDNAASQKIAAAAGFSLQRDGEVQLWTKAADH